MVDFPGSLTPCRLKSRAVPVGRSPFNFSSQKRSIRQRVKFEISYPERGSKLPTNKQNESKPFESFASSGTSFLKHTFGVLKGKPITSRLEKLPLFVRKEGQKLQYAWDGDVLRIIPVEQDRKSVLLDSAPKKQGEAFGFVLAIPDRVRWAFYRTFVPEQVRAHYLVYMRWKFFHRLCSSIIQVQCTQAMLQAIGVGARRSLPAAAGLNWVLKDGLGRLGRFAFSGLLGSTFDANLKKVRFSTSVLYSLSLGLEMLTPIFPNCFLPLATVANIGRSIALAAYLATSSAIHKSFAVGDNLADIAAKGQVQTVVADNLGLAIAVAIGSFVRYSRRLERALPLMLFPVLTGVDLYAIYRELQSVHLQTLNKARLEIIADHFIHKRRVPNAKEVSKEEGRQLLQIPGQRTLPLRIGAIDPKGWRHDDILQIFQHQSGQQYAIFNEQQGLFPFYSQPGLLLWLHDGFTPKDVITAILQVGLMRSTASSRWGLSTDNPPQREIRPKAFSEIGQPQPIKPDLGENDGRNISKHWASWVAESRQQAEARVDDLIAAMEDNGWQTQHVLLDPHERQPYSIHLNV